MNKNKKKRRGNVCIILAFILLVAAILVSVYNHREDRSAKNDSQEIVDSLKIAENTGDAKNSDDAENADELPIYIQNPDMEMPTEIIDDVEYIGTLTIPDLQLELPVSSEWSYTQLRKSPCRYTGSVYAKNMILCGHNYTSHFGNLKTLNQGENIQFTDVDGNIFNYSVAEIDILQPTDIEKIETGNWDLTLFTCTIGGQARVTVRCKLESITDSATNKTYE